MLLHANFLKKILIVGGNNMIDEIEVKHITPKDDAIAICIE